MFCFKNSAADGPSVFTACGWLLIRGAVCVCVFSG